MLNFKELPQDGILFEQLIREIFILSGFECHWTGVGPDGGRDLLVIEKLIGPLSDYERKWLVSCKHKAHSGKPVGRDEAGNISEDCDAVNADGYLLACSSYPSASLVTRLQEIEQNRGIVTKVWDAVTIEKKLLTPQHFSLIHRFFPESSSQYPWNIYQTLTPGLWAVSYKDYFFYIECRLRNMHPELQLIQGIVSEIENIKLNIIYNMYEKKDLRIRYILLDDKYGSLTIDLDCICDYKQYSSLTDDEISEMPYFINEALKQNLELIINGNFISLFGVNWHIKCIKTSKDSDGFDSDHSDYYKRFFRDSNNYGIGLPF